MSAYIIANYRITNAADYEKYVPAMLPILQDYGGETLVADYASETVEGEPGHVTVVVRFSSKEAARAWHDSPEYQSVVHLRTDNTEGNVVLVDAWAPAT